MRTRALVGVLGFFALLVAGCSGPSPAAPTTPVPTSAPTVTPLATPSAGPGEIVRSTVERSVVDIPSARLPDVARLSIEVACAGPDGSTMRWALQGADGTPFGPSGVQDCTGPPTTSGLGIAGVTPKRIEVSITPSAGIAGGYAIVRRDGEG